MQSAKYWKKRSIQRTVRSEKASEKYAKQIDRVYQNASKRIQDDINQIYRTYGKQQGIDVDKLLEKLSTKETANFWKKMTKTGDLDYIKSNYKSRISRLEQLQGELYSRVHEMRTQENDLHTKAHTNTIDEAYHRTVFDTSKGVGANISFGGLNKNTLDTLMNDNWQGSTFSKRIWGNTDSLGVKGKDILGSALLTGKSRARVATEFTELFGVARNSAERLIRTETNYYQNEAEAIASIDMGLEEYIYVAVLDKRTSSICASTDTLKFKYKDREQGRNYPPLHPNCRSTTRPFVGDEYEPKTRKARDVNGDPITIKSVSYKEWREKYGIDKVQQPTKVPTPKPTTTTKAGVKIDRTNPVYAGVRKGKAMKPEMAILANPNYGKDPNRKYKTNCQKTVPTYELRRRGYNLEALKNDKDSYQISHNMGIAKMWGKQNMDYYSHININKRADGTEYKTRKRTVKSEVVKQMKSYPEGARIQLAYAYVKRRTGHTIVLERVPVSKKYPNGLIFADPQPMKLSGTFQLKGKTAFSMIRIDDKEIVGALVPIIAKEKKL
jgi:SPP1 gp7 family putative phage head morphogenesis protein